MAKQALGVQLVDGNSGQEELDWLYRTVQRLTQQANLPMPEVGFYNSAEVNAFATGPSKNRSLVAVSSGLLRGMRRDEVEGVLAHEVAHIANGDMVTMALLQGVINAFVMFLARVIVMLLRGQSRERGYSFQDFMLIQVLQMVLGILGSFVTAWFSRQREFRADYGGAQLAGRSKMIGALRRLAANKELVDTQHAALATFKISGTRGFLALMSTHPPLEDRIAALEQFQQQ
jgi:heat shock protein HtpX